MKLEGTYTIAATPDAVWRNLMDPAVLQRATPGCQSLVEKAPNQYSAVLKAGVGPVKGVFHGDITIADMVPEKSYTLTSLTPPRISSILTRVRVPNRLPSNVARTVSPTAISSLA
jgi:carbon monoxide dehydrogenase subunit G